MSGVTPSHQAELFRLQAVNAVAIAVSQSLDLDSVLESALEAAMQVFSVESGGIYLMDQATDRLKLEVHRNLSPTYLSEKSVVGLYDGCTGFAARTRDIFAAYDHPESIYVCEDSRRLLGIDCLVASPLVAHGKVLGVLELFAPTSRRLTRDEGRLLNTICTQIAIAIENASLYQQTLDTVKELEITRRELIETNAQLQSHLEEEVFIARTLQQSLLPPEPTPIEGLDVGSFYASATRHALIGGDFYDVIELPGRRYAFVIGDASGHGIVVSPRSAAVKFSLRSYLGVGRAPARALELANRTFISQRILDSFVTAFVATINADTGEMRYSLAGHPPALLFRPSRGGAQILEVGTPALGIGLKTRYPLLSTKLAPSDILLMYTDGLTDARDPSTQDFFGFRRIFKELEDAADSSAKEIAAQIAQAAYDFSGGNLSDDLAILVVKRELGGKGSAAKA